MAAEFLDALQRLARERRDAPALLDERRTLSFEGLENEVSRLAARFAASGVVPGARVAVLLENRIEVATAIYACWWVGAVPALLGAGPPGTVGQALALCGAGAVVCSKLSRSIAVAANARIVLDVDAESLAQATASRLGAADVGADAVLLFTSGSTVTPKGVRLSHEALLRNAHLVCTYLGLSENDVTSFFLPLSTRMGLTPLLAYLLVGAPAALSTGLFNESGFALKSTGGMKLTGFSAAPTHLATLLDRGLLGVQHLPALRYVRVGAGLLDREMVLRLKKERPEVDVLGTYGMTECGEIAVLSDQTMLLDGTSRVGRACADLEVRVMGPEGAPLPAGEVGEIEVSGPRMMTGYLTDDAPRERGAWFSTGDRGAFDPSGHLQFIGRKKDLIKVAGVSVDLNGLADWLRRVAGVAEAVAIGTPDPFLGEAAYVFVVPTPGATLEQKKLWEACQAALPQAAKPKAIYLVDEIPRLASGKVDRGALRESLSRMNRT